MKRSDLQSMYGATPVSFTRRVSFALKKTEERPVKMKETYRAVLLAAAIMLALIATAYALFSSEVAEYFGRAYGGGMKEWLEKGGVAANIPANTFVMDGAIFTVDEVVYRDNGLYGIGTIRPASDNVVLIAEDCTPDEPFGYDIHGAGGRAEIAPEGAQTVADAARERNAALLEVSMILTKVGVDGGEMLMPDSVGYSIVPQRDGSVRAVFELEDAYVIAEGASYALSVEARTRQMSLTGEILEGSEHMEHFVVSVAPEPIRTPTSTAETAAPIPAINGDYEIITTAEYDRTGVLPVYRAIKRDFTASAQPEWFNQTGIVARDAGSVRFADHAILQLSPEAVFYTEYDAPEEGGAPAWTSGIPALAGMDIDGFAAADGAYAVENAELTHITLDRAQATLEALLDRLGLKGYACDNATDMSLARIQRLGGEYNALCAEGKLGPNATPLDYQSATVDDEGYYLSYHRFAGQKDAGLDDFCAYAYVTGSGVRFVAIRDEYACGEVCGTPDKLIAPWDAANALPGEIAVSRYADIPGKQAVGILSVRLTYRPMRAADKTEGMVFSPVWIVVYRDQETIGRNSVNRAEFDAVNGRLLNASFK